MFRIVENDFGYFDLWLNGSPIPLASTHSAPLQRLVTVLTDVHSIEDISNHDAAKGYTLQRQPRSITLQTV